MFGSENKLLIWLSLLIFVCRWHKVARRIWRRITINVKYCERWKL